MKTKSRKSIVLTFVLIIFCSITGAAMIPSNRDVSKIDLVKQFLSKISSGDQPFKSAHGTAKTITGLNLRKGPDTSYAIVHVLVPGAVVSIEGVCDNNWNKVKHVSQENKIFIGFVNSKYLTKLSNKTNSVENRGFHKANLQADIFNVSSVNYQQIQKKVSISKMYVAKSNLRNRSECKMVKVKVRVDGVLTEKLVETCKSLRNGSWGY